MKLFMANLRYEKLSYEVRGIIFETHRQMQIGWSEEIYHRALAQILESKGIPFQFKPRQAIFHHNIEVHTFESDLIVYDQIILELKALPHTDFAPAHYAQLIHYLKCWKMDLGLLVNFGPPSAIIRRVLWDEPDVLIYENYDQIRNRIDAANQRRIEQIRQSIVTIADQFGLGYSEVLYRKIAAIELRHSGLDCQSEVKIPSKLNGLSIQELDSDHLLIEHQHLLGIRSLLSHPTKYDFAQMKTYLNSLGLKTGIVVNFGKQQLQIYGVSAN
jgi:GxxExxY protein